MQAYTGILHVRLKAGSDIAVNTSIRIVTATRFQLVAGYEKINWVWKKSLALPLKFPILTSYNNITGHYNRHSHRV